MMIKTLRITSIAVAALAVVFLVSSVVFGFKGNSEIEEFLNKPGAVAAFTKARGASSGGSDKADPLVKQAQSYAHFLNPPAPERAVAKIDPRDLLPKNIEPAKPQPKFKLVGISYCQGDPSESLAFVDEVGKGSHWVRVDATLGHLKIEEINEDSVVVSSGDEQMTLTADSGPVSVSSTLETDGDSVASRVAAMRAGNTGSSPAKAITDATRSNGSKNTNAPAPNVAASSRTASRPRPAPPAVDPAERAKMEELISQLRGVQNSLNTEKSGRKPLSEAEKAARIDELMKNAKPSTHVTPDEAKKLDDLGRRLNRRSSSSPTRIPARPPVRRAPRSSGR